MELSCSGWACWSIFGKVPSWDFSHLWFVYFQLIQRHNNNGSIYFLWYSSVLLVHIQLPRKIMYQVLDCARKRIHNQQLRYMYVDINLAYIKISLIKLAVRPLQTTHKSKKCSYLPFTSQLFSQLVHLRWFFNSYIWATIFTALFKKNLCSFLCSAEGPLISFFSCAPMYLGMTIP